MCPNSLAWCSWTRTISVFTSCLSQWITQHVVHFCTQIHLCVNKSECDRHGRDNLYVCVQWLGSGYTTQVTSSISAPTTKFIFSKPLKQRDLRLIGLTKFRRPITTTYAFLSGYSQHPVAHCFQKQTVKWEFKSGGLFKVRCSQEKLENEWGKQSTEGKKPNKGVFSGEVLDLTRFYGE